MLFRIRVNHYSENRLPLQIHHPFGDKVLCRASEYSILLHQATCRPSGCFLQSRKYSVARQSAQSCRSKHRVGRHDALSNRGITNLGQEWSFFDWSKYSVARHDALSSRGITNLGQEWSFSDRRKYSVARQSTRFARSKLPSARQDAFSICASTLSPVRVLLPQYVKDRAART